jgi:glycosyltransferase involved in cell wall biosynthesis
MSAPAVSVLLPVRDGRRYLKEALDSVLGQTLAELEVIVVDDGSTDGTDAVLGAYDDERLRVLRQEPSGLVAALRLAAEAAQAPLLARMDADDVSLPERLERQRRFLEDHPRVGVLGCGVELVDEDGSAPSTILLPRDDGALRRRLLLRNPFTHGSVVLQRTAFDDAGGYRPRHGANEDYDLWRRIARNWELAALPEVLYRYRRHGKAVTQTDPERVRLREALRDELWDEPELLRAAWGEADSREARALVREALRRRRPFVAAKIGTGYIMRASRMSS